MGVFNPMLWIWAAGLLLTFLGIAVVASVLAVPCYWVIRQRTGGRDSDTETMLIAIAVCLL